MSVGLPGVFPDFFELRVSLGNEGHTARAWAPRLGPEDPDVLYSRHRRPPDRLSGITSCDSAAIRKQIRIVPCERPAKRQKPKPCETVLFSHFFLLVVRNRSWRCLNQRKTKGQQLKGKIVSALFHTFWHFSTLFQSFSEFFLQDFFLELRDFTAVLVQREEKRIKDNKKKKTKPFCTLVVARLSSSN